jgi:pyridoxal phosphate enzyme (YggS family)
VTDLGENRVSEILDKTAFLQGEFTMHLIGHLQTNKVARVLPFVQMVQSVDRDRLIEYIERYVPPETRLPVLVEVNTTGEPSKHGCLPDDCRKIMERVAMSNKLVPAGLMTIGPLGAEEKQTREAFSLLRTLAERNSDIVARPHLSMGMSGDFEWAIEEGATMVRIGSILCGVRN